MSAFGPDMRSRSFYETRQAGSARSNVFRCRGEHHLLDSKAVGQVSNRRLCLRPPYVSRGGATSSGIRPTDEPKGKAFRSCGVGWKRRNDHHRFVWFITDDGGRFACAKRQRGHRYERHSRRAWSYRHSSLDAPTENSGTTTAGDAFDFGNTPANLASGETLTQSNGASITDAEEPALSHSRTASVSIGGPGAENFVFAPGIGADTIVNFNPQQDSIEFDHFADVQSIQELQSLLTNDGHGDAVIDLGHNDSLTLQGVTTQQLQQVIQQGHVFLH